MNKLFIMVSFFMMLSIVGCDNTGNSSSNNNENSGAVGVSSTTDNPIAGEENTVPTITVNHELGETVVPINPESVVVFDMGSLDTLLGIGVEPDGIPRGNIPDYLVNEISDNVENTGSLKEPNMEKINELSPDLIIISGRQGDFYEELSKIAPTIYLGVDTQDYMNSFESNVRLLGEIYGKESQVEEALEDINSRIESFNEINESIEDKALIVLFNEGSFSAYGAGSRFGFIHDVMGIPPVDESIDVSTHGAVVSNEYILEQNPDYLFVIDRNEAIGADSDTTATAEIENELVRETNAFKNGNIVYLSPDIWYLSGGGLISVDIMIDEVFNAFVE